MPPRRSGERPNPANGYIITSPPHSQSQYHPPPPHQTQQPYNPYNRDARDAREANGWTRPQQQQYQAYPTPSTSPDPLDSSLNADVGGSMKYGNG
ncbi:hypothetical protein HK102_002048, partial [Quaeritorhiza haematococci]